MDHILSSPEVESLKMKETENKGFYTNGVWCSKIKV